MEDKKEGEKEKISENISSNDGVDHSIEDSNTTLFPIDLTTSDGVDKRTKVVRELYTSEQIYVKNLTSMIEGYVGPLKAKNILNSKVISGIFSNVEIIQKFHLHFLASMSQRLKTWDSEQLIGDIFLSLAPYLKLYSQYCSNYDHSMSLVQQHKKSSLEFAKFLESAQNNPLFKGSYITSFLILPIQRIPRYELFLKELLKTTKEDHTDRCNLQQALGLITTLAESVNESCQKAENIQKMIEISKAISMEKLLKPARKYIREDDIDLSSEIYSGVSKCYVFSDLIVVTVKKSRTMPRLYLSYALGYCWVYGASDDTIQLITKTNTLILKFLNNESKESWETEVVKILGELIEIKKLKEKRSSFKIVEGDDGVFRAVNKDTKEEEKETTVTEDVPPPPPPPPEKKKKNRLIDLNWKKKKSHNSEDLDKKETIREFKVGKTRSASPIPSRAIASREERKSLRRSLSISNNIRTKNLDPNITPLQHALNEIIIATTPSKKKSNEV